MAHKQLTTEQRHQIFALKQAGQTQKQIAEITHVNQSTICRELHRNGGLCGYGCSDAKFFDAKRKKSTPNNIKMTPIIVNIIEQKVREKWSPQQISGWLKHSILFNISHMTIYRHIRNDRKAGGNLYKHLRRKGKKYRPKDPDGSRYHIKDRVGIAERPHAVQLKERIGDWEGDTVVGKYHSGFLVTVVERITKFTVTKRVNDKTAKTVTDAVIELLEPYKDSVLTITFDNGREFADHKRIAVALACDVFFADPYSSWQRGLNEQTNGLLRQYWPKKTDFKLVSHEEVEQVINQLNDRPRFLLDFSTPSALMLEHLKNKSG